MINCRFENGRKTSLRHCVVDALVIDKGKILLIKRAPRLLNGGKYAVIGGYIERDEDSKQALIREAKEETGYHIMPVELFRIADNPDRPQEDRQNVAFFYLAKVIKKIGGGNDEVSEIRWFDLNNLPPKNLFAFDHYGTIELYKRYLKKKFPLPFVGKI
ncbi:MAG: NUDIX hydrolase [Candidatus Levybacteria bacterium]|nr:NUDIX hydrolase [Candidatus Levybacteria bacterium]